jgi:hypothetical protein
MRRASSPWHLCLDLLLMFGERLRLRQPRPVDLLPLALLALASHLFGPAMIALKVRRGADAADPLLARPLRRFLWRACAGRRIDKILVDLKALDERPQRCRS